MNKLVVLMMVVLLVPVAMAIPTFHHFYGDVVDVNGSVINDSFDVVTYIDGSPSGGVGATEGNYGYDELLFVEDGSDGDTVEFYVDGRSSVNNTFSNEGSTDLPLVFDDSKEQVLCGNGICDFGEDCSSCSGDCGGCDVGGPGSGGGGGGGGDRVCIEWWVCDDWSPEICPVTRQQTRTCTDRNNCGTVANKPNEVRNCYYYVAPEEEVVEEEEGIEERIIERLAPKEKRKVSTRTFIILGVVLLSSLVLVMFKWQYLLKGKWEGYDISRLRVYIKKYLALKYPRRKIIEACRKVGWKTSVVKRAIKEEKKRK
jgi:hypothetical protein